MASLKKEWIGWRAVLAPPERPIAAPPSMFSSTRLRDAQGANTSRARRPVTWQIGKVRWRQGKATCPPVHLSTRHQTTDITLGVFRRPHFGLTLPPVADA